MFDFNNLSVVDLMRSGAIIVAFVATLLTDKRGQASSFMKLDALVNLVLGVGYMCFPGILFNYQVAGKVDDLHTLLVRFVGVSLLLSTTLYFFIFKTRDGNAGGSYLLARTLGVSMTLINSLHAHTEYANKATHFSDQHVSFTLLLLVLLLLGFVIHLLRFSDFTDRTSRVQSPSDRTPLHVLIDVLICLPVILFFFAFPSKPLADLDLGIKAGGLHHAITRMIYTSVFPLVLFGLTSLQSGSEQDRRGYLVTRLLMYVFFIPLGIIYVPFKLDTYTYIKMAMFVPFVGNLFIGAFYRDINERKRQ